jgi:membrane fusion protein, multidrug efflux system
VGPESAGHTVCGRWRGGEGGPAAVEVARASAVQLDDDAQAVGSLRAVQSVTLRPEVSGRVRSLGFTDGQRVRHGQLLLQLDDTLQQAQLKQAQAQAAIARTNLQRSRELAAQNFVSQSAVDQNAAALEVAQAQVALAQAQISRMRVTAPFSATAGIRSVNVGDYIKDGADVVSLDDTSSVYVDFKLPERYAARVRSGHPFQSTIDALPGKAFAGTVLALDSAIDADGRALLVRGRMANPAGVLRTGMFARVRVVFSSRSDALMVPEEALVPQGGRQYLFKVVPGPDGGMVSQKLEARVGLRKQGKAEITQGLAPGDTVVTAGHARLLRGDAVPVRVVDLNRPAGGANGKPGVAASGGGPSAPMPAASAPSPRATPPA